MTKPVTGTLNLATEYAAVFIGGAVGSLLRQMLIPALPAIDWWTSVIFTNALACFILGWLFAIRSKLHSKALLFGAVGFCGGLSTFSTLASEIFQGINEQLYAQATIATLLEIMVGLIAVWAGERAGQFFTEDIPV